MAASTKKTQLRELKQENQGKSAMQLLLRQPLVNTNKGEGAVELFKEGVAHVVTIAPDEVKLKIDALMRPETQGDSFRPNVPSRAERALKQLLQPPKRTFRVKRGGKVRVEKLAVDILEQARLEARKISDLELKRILRALPIKQNSNRKNIGKHQGVTIGIIKKRGDRSCVISHSTKRLPNTIRLICRWSESRCHGYAHRFPFTSITINRNFPSKVHRDINNEGASIVVAVGAGAWKGGRLLYWPGKRHTNVDLPQGDAPVKLDVRKPLIFDGNHAHSVDSFQGERISMVFFNAQGFDRGDTDLVQRLLDYRIDPGTDAAMQFYKGLLFQDGYRRFSD